MEIVGGCGGGRSVYGTRGASQQGVMSKSELSVRGRAWWVGPVFVCGHLWGGQGLFSRISRGGKGRNETMTIPARLSIGRGGGTAATERRGGRGANYGLT